MATTNREYDDLALYQAITADEMKNSVLREGVLGGYVEFDEEEPFAVIRVTHQWQVHADVAKRLLDGIA